MKEVLLVLRAMGFVMLMLAGVFSVLSMRVMLWPGKKRCPPPPGSLPLLFKATFVPARLTGFAPVICINVMPGTKSDIKL